MKNITSSERSVDTEKHDILSLSHAPTLYNTNLQKSPDWKIKSQICK